MKKIAVLAGTRRQFDEYIRERFIYIDSVRDIHGIEVEEIIKIGNWYEKKDSYETLKAVESRMTK